MGRWSKSDYEESCLKIQQWLEDILTEHPPKKNIKAFYFGLFDSKYADGVTAPVIYISGSTSYDPDDETADWACLDDDSYEPEGRYIGSKILRGISSTLAIKDFRAERQIGEYVLILGYAALAIKTASNAIDPRLLEGKQGRRPIAVGFDEGDFILIH